VEVLWEKKGNRLKKRRGENEEKRREVKNWKVKSRGNIARED
jgi:hypothetical protein